MAFFSWLIFEKLVCCRIRGPENRWNDEKCSKEFRYVCRKACLKLALTDSPTHNPTSALPTLSPTLVPTRNSTSDISDNPKIYLAYALGSLFAAIIVLSGYILLEKLRLRALLNRYREVNSVRNDAFQVLSSREFSQFY